MWRYDESQKDNAGFLGMFIAFLQSCLSQQAYTTASRPEFVPSRVLVTQWIHPEAPFAFTGRIAPGLYSVTSNQWGAISAMADNGKLMGIKPGECVVLEMCQNPHL